MILVGIMIAGGAGALARYLVDIAVTSKLGHVFPWGTLVINVSGSAVLGFLTGLALYQGMPNAPEAILGSGFCGGYTTFSTHMVDTVKLGESGNLRGAGVNVLMTLLLATGAAGAGMALASG